MDALAAAPVRPLRIGEVFDRAITLCVRYFAPLASIALVIVVPLAIASAFQQHAATDSFSRMLRDIQRTHGGSPPPPVFPDAAMWVPVIAALVLSPFGYMAITAAIASVYKGEPVDWRRAYAAALSRWAAAIGLLLLSAVVFSAAGMAAVFAVSIVVVISVAAYTAVKAAGIVIAVFAVALFLASLVFMMLAFITVFLMFDALVVERLGMFAAFASGFARVFNRKQFGRTLLLALAFFALQMGIAIIAYTVLALQLFLHAFALGTVLSAVVQLVSMLFFGVLFAVYYFDVRVRLEGVPA